LSATLLATLVAIACIGISRSQTNGVERDDTHDASGEFHFARMIYQDRAGGGFYRGGYGRGWWRQDAPAADIHFTQALRRLTRIDAGEYVAVDLRDGRLFEYPWLYATQTGFWDLSDQEIAMLREYLLRGGFFVADDFWQDGEWEVFREAMGRLFPEYPIVELTGGNAEVLHVLYDIEGRLRSQVYATCAISIRASARSSGCRTRTGAASTTRKGGSWSPRISTKTSATRGSTRTGPSTPSR
jgi:hypothetical protein